VTFSEPVDPTSVTPSTVRLLDASGQPVPQSSGWPTTEGALVTIRPAQELEEGASYRVSVLGGPGGVRDLAGNAMSSNWSQSPAFKTQEPDDPPGEPGQASVSSSHPAAGSADVDLNLDQARVDFDRDMSGLTEVLSRAELQERLRVGDGFRALAQAPESPSFVNGGRTALIVLAEPVAAGGHYRTVVDLTGDQLAQRLDDAGHGDLAMSEVWRTDPSWVVENAVTLAEYEERESSRRGTLDVLYESIVPGENADVPCEPLFSVSFVEPVAPDSVAERISIVRPGSDAIRALLERVEVLESGGLPRPSGGVGGLLGAAQRMLQRKETEETVVPVLREQATELVELLEPPVLRDAQTIAFEPGVPLRPGTLYEIRIKTGDEGVRLVTEGGQTIIEEPAEIRIPFYTEIAPEQQDGTLGVGP
jgi:hypothetical protein